MLILTRKEDESIMLGSSVEVKVLKLEDGRVKLGIVAPESLRIYRREVYEEIIQENKRATASPKHLLDVL